METRIHVCMNYESMQYDEVRRNIQAHTDIICTCENDTPEL